MKFPFAIAVGAALVSSAASATVMSFSDRSSFDAATGPQTNILSPSIPINASGLGFGGLTFTPLPAPGQSIQTNYNGTALMNNEMAFAFESFDILFAAPVFGFGMDIVEPSQGGNGFGTCDVAACVDSTFVIEVLSGTTALASFNVTPDDDALSFFGVAGDMSFDRITVRETVGSNDDEFFGNFVTAAAAPVPLPATGLLLLAGLAAMGATRRRM